MAFNSKVVGEGLNPCSEKYKFNIENSIYSLGTNNRIELVIKKLLAGETVYVAAIGGSVTEGAGPKDENGKELFTLGYAYKFVEKLKARYSKAKIEFDCSAVSGSPSSLGVIRYKKDIDDVFGQSPDILIIEYSVNDGDDCTGTRGFERIIRNVLEAKDDAVAIPVYAHATYQNTQDSMMPVADFYGLPQISIRNALSNPDCMVNLEQGGEYFTDYAHPTEEGHNFMADCIMAVFEKREALLATEPKSESAPVTTAAATSSITATTTSAAPACELAALGYKNARPFTEFYALYPNTVEADKNVQLFPGEFCSVDKGTQSIKKGGTEFPSNWHKEQGTGNGQSFSLKLKCKAFILAYKGQGSFAKEKFGTAEVFVDGKKIMDCNGAPEGAWGNCLNRLIIDEEECNEHLVEVKMAEGFEDLGFTILAVGYSK